MKPTEEGRSLLGKVSEHPPYPGAKLYFRIDDEMEDREMLQRLLHTTARALPLPRAKLPRVRKAVAVKPGRAPRSR